MKFTIYGLRIASTGQVITMDNITPQNADEPTYQDHKPATTPNPYIHDLGESKLPPPPPRTPSRRIGKIVTGVLYIIIVNAASIFAYFIGFESGKSTSIRYTPTPTTAIPTSISYVKGLSSSDPRIFVGSFAKALMLRDIDTLTKYVDIPTGWVYGLPTS